MCDRQSTKKYVVRKSPPFPANKCPEGQRRKGNDGRMYKAVANVNGVNRWVLASPKRPVRKSSPKRPKKSKRPVRKTSKRPVKTPKRPTKKRSSKKKRVYVDNAMNRRLGRVGKSY